MNGRRIAILGALLAISSVLFGANWYFSSPRTAARSKMRAGKGRAAPAMRTFAVESPSTEVREPTPEIPSAPNSNAPQGGEAVAANPSRPAAVETPPPVSPAAQVVSAEEAAIRSRLEPLVANRADANMTFVVCEIPKPGEQETTGGPARAEGGDRSKPVCRTRFQARDPAALDTLLRQASSIYSGHLAAELNERFDAFTGRWFEADINLGTVDTHPIPQL